jgi:hypothetical protein
MSGHIEALHSAFDDWAAHHRRELTLSGRVPGMTGHPYCMGGTWPIYENEHAHLGENSWWRDADDRRYWTVFHQSNALGVVIRSAVVDDFGSLRAVESAP